MQWMAELARGCPAETNWKILRRIAGDINGVKFHIYAGHFYTDLLGEQEIEAISDHPWVNLVCAAQIDEETNMAPSPTPPEEPATAQDNIGATGKIARPRGRPRK